jgi:hypothetical protein
MAPALVQRLVLHARVAVRVEPAACLFQHRVQLVLTRLVEVLGHVSRVQVAPHVAKLASVWLCLAQAARSLSAQAHLPAPYVPWAHFAPLVPVTW